MCTFGRFYSDSAVKGLRGYPGQLEPSIIFKTKPRLLLVVIKITLDCNKSIYYNVCFDFSIRTRTMIKGPSQGVCVGVGACVCVGGGG